MHCGQTLNSPLTQSVLSGFSETLQTDNSARECQQERFALNGTESSPNKNCRSSRTRTSISDLLSCDEASPYFLILPSAIQFPLEVCKPVHSEPTPKNPQNPLLHTHLVSSSSMSCQCLEFVAVLLQPSVSTSFFTSECRGTVIEHRKASKF